MFKENGEVKAAKGDAAAKATIDDMQLWRKDLVMARETVIKQAMRGARAVLSMKGLPDGECRKLISKLIADGLSPYSEAANQCVRELWRGAGRGRAV